MKTGVLVFCSIVTKDMIITGGKQRVSPRGVRGRLSFPNIRPVANVVVSQAIPHPIIGGEGSFQRSLCFASVPVVTSDRTEGNLIPSLRREVLAGYKETQDLSSFVTEFPISGLREGINAAKFR